jgi:hypothetical protein
VRGRKEEMDYRVMGKRNEGKKSKSNHLTCNLSKRRRKQIWDEK